MFVVHPHTVSRKTADFGDHKRRDTPGNWEFADGAGNAQRGHRRHHGEPIGLCAGRDPTRYPSPVCRSPTR